MTWVHLIMMRQQWQIWFCPLWLWLWLAGQTTDGNSIYTGNSSLDNSHVCQNYLFLPILTKNFDYILKFIATNWNLRHNQEEKETKWISRRRFGGRCSLALSPVLRPKINVIWRRPGIVSPTWGRRGGAGDKRFGVTLHGGLAAAAAVSTLVFLQRVLSLPALGPKIKGHNPWRLQCYCCRVYLGLS